MLHISANTLKFLLVNGKMAAKKSDFQKDFSGTAQLLQGHLDKHWYAFAFQHRNKKACFFIHVSETYLLTLLNRWYPEELQRLR